MRILKKIESLQWRPKATSLIGSSTCTFAPIADFRYVAIGELIIFMGKANIILTSYLYLDEPTVGVDPLLRQR